MNEYIYCTFPRNRLPLIDFPVTFHKFTSSFKNAVEHLKYYYKIFTLPLNVAPTLLYVIVTKFDRVISIYYFMINHGCKSRCKSRCVTVSLSLHHCSFFPTCRTLLKCNALNLSDITCTINTVEVALN